MIKYLQTLLGILCFCPILSHANTIHSGHIQNNTDKPIHFKFLPGFNTSYPNQTVGQKLTLMPHKTMDFKVKADHYPAYIEILFTTAPLNKNQQSQLICLANGELYSDDNPVANMYSSTENPTDTKQICDSSMDENSFIVKYDE